MTSPTEQYDVLIAAAQGALAATAAYADVSEHPNACEVHAVGFSLV